MFGWLDAGQAKEFGGELARFFMEKMPLDAQLNESKQASKTQYALDKMSVKVNAFKQDHTLNAFRTAKLANSFKWHLTDAGYDKEYVDTLVAWLLKRL